MHSMFNGTYTNVHYLEHESLVIPYASIPRLRDTVYHNEHLTLYGSPISLANGPRSTNAWFQYGRASDASHQQTAVIPQRITTHHDDITGEAQTRPLDILITHGAPHGRLDRHGGCADLALRVQQVQPLLHIFGHGTSLLPASLPITLYLCVYLIIL
jgi:hypothetical protein